MKPAAFELHRPDRVEEALGLLADVAEDGGLVLAGGQSLVPMMAFRMATPPHLIDINRIPEFGRLVVEDRVLSIGPTVRHAAFHQPAAPGPLGPALAAMSRHIAHYPIRLRGTFCGSLANADPASEWCLAAATFGAEVVAASTSGRRTIPFDGFVEGLMSTVLEPDEMIVEARLPLPPDDARIGFYEFSRRAGDYAMGMSLAAFRVVDGVVSEARIGLGAIESSARRMPEAEAALIGRALGDEAFRAAADAAAAAVEPLDDPVTSAEHRVELAAVVVRRALERAAAGVGENGATGRA